MRHYHPLRTTKPPGRVISRLLLWMTVFAAHLQSPLPAHAADVPNAGTPAAATAPATQDSAPRTGDATTAALGESSSSDLEQVTITAQKRTERLEEIPCAA